MFIRAHGNGLAGVGLALVLGGAVVACGGTKAASQPPPATAAATRRPPQQGVPQQQATPREAPRTGSAEPSQGNDEGDAELVVSRDVVARCPTLRLVRQHVSEIDPDMVWLAVLESIADCMSEGGPMAAQSLGVSGDEEHRHVVREVLGTRGVAPTRVVAEPDSGKGAAECQGGTDCLKRVEITIIVP